MRSSFLLFELKERGITLQVHGNRLRYHPRSAVGPDLLTDLRKYKADIIRLLNLEDEAPKDRLSGSRPSGRILPEELMMKLIDWPDPPSDSELRSRGASILRNHAVARSRIELNGAADAWDRMCEKFKNQRK